MLQKDVAGGGSLGTDFVAVPSPLPHNGLLLLDKPAGWTSHDVVSFARKKLKMRSIGHCGTLDPAATGLLVLLLGEATKLSQYLLEQDKSYLMQIRMGVTTNSGDADGEVLSEKPVTATTEEILKICQDLQGDLDLPVPAHSAVKVNGERLYKKAHRGEEVETPRRVMRFYDFSFVSFDGQELRARISCSKGSYIRSWAVELGERLGCGASLSGLRRLSSLPYGLEQAITCEQLEASVTEGRWVGGYIPMAETLMSWKCLRAVGHDEHLLRNGQISQGLKAQLIRIFQPGLDVGVKILSANSDLVALIGLEVGRGFVIRRVFRY